MKTVVMINDFRKNHKQEIGERIGQLVDLVFVDQFLADQKIVTMLKDAEIVVGWPKADLLGQSSVQLLQIGSSGWDAYENKGLEKNAIRLCTAKGVYSIGVAEAAIGLMFAIARNFNLHIKDKTQGIFKRHEPYDEITGSTACILGVGDIGSTLAKKCFGLDMRVIGVDHFQRKLYYVDEWYSLNDLKLAVTKADHVFITVSGETSNQKMISKNLLNYFKEGACLYNLSRGNIVDQTALIQCLKNGKLKGAGLDVTDPEPPEKNDEIFKLENVILSGHSGGLSAGWEKRLIDLICQNIINYVNGWQLINELDWVNKKII